MGMCMISTNQAVKTFLLSLENIEVGSLEVTLPNQMGVKTFQGNLPGPHATINFKTLDAIKSIILYGDIGFGKGYINGFWETDCLQSLLLISCKNDQCSKSSLYNGKVMPILLYKLLQYFKRNSIAGSIKNIQYHYDVSNDFYQLWLDKEMNYSTSMALEDENISLEDAQYNKNKFIFERLNNPQHILEIGCGWGAFMETAASQNVCIKGLSLSKQQLLYANNRLKKMGLNKYAQGFFCDYRKEEGTYDNIVSIEMIEHVGIENWFTFFKKIQNCLKKDGRAVIQSSLIHDDVYDSYVKTTDFIRTFIFPGGVLPADKKIKEIAIQTGFHIEDYKLLGHDAARTMSEWLNRFINSKNKIRKLGYQEEFIRMWEFYLVYCLSAYTSGRINVGQYVLSRLN